MAVTLLAAMVVAALVIATGCSAGQESEPPDPFENIDCDPGQPECAELINAAIRASRPTPPPAEVEAEVKEILFDNEVIKAMVADRQLGRDYWISMSYLRNPEHGVQGAMVMLVLAEPTSYEGEVPTASDPCDGHYGGDEEVPPSDPCLDQPREYGTTHVAYAGVNTIHTQVDLGRGEVVKIGAATTPPDELAEMIAYFKSRQGQ